MYLRGQIGTIWCLRNRTATRNNAVTGTPSGYAAIAIGAAGAFSVLRIGSATQWQTPVIEQVVEDAPSGYAAIAIGAAGAFSVLRIGSATQWQTPVISQG